MEADAPGIKSKLDSTRCWCVNEKWQMIDCHTRFLRQTQTHTPNHRHPCCRNWKQPQQHAMFDSFVFAHFIVEFSLYSASMLPRCFSGSSDEGEPTGVTGAGGGGGEGGGEGGGSSGGASLVESVGGGLLAGAGNENAEMEDNNSARSFASSNPTYRDVNPQQQHGSTVNETLQQEYQRRNSGAGIYLDLSPTMDRQQHGYEKERHASAAVPTSRERDEDGRSWEFSENQICTPSYRIDYREYIEIFFSFF